MAKTAGEPACESIMIDHSCRYRYTGCWLSFCHSCAACYVVTTSTVQVATHCLHSHVNEPTPTTAVSDCIDLLTTQQLLLS